MKQRVFILTSWYPSNANPAAGIFVEDQARALQRRYDIVVLAVDLGGWRDRLRGASEAVSLEQRSGVDVVRIRGLATIPRSRAAGYAAYSRAASAAYRFATHRFGQPDVLHAHVARHAGWAASLLGRSAGHPVVITEHSGPFSMHLTSSIDREQVRWALENADSVVAVSPALRDDIRAFAPVPVEVVGNCVDTDFFQPLDTSPHQLATRPVEVLSVALLSRGKRVELIIRAVARVTRDAGQDVRLTIVGDGPARRVLEAEAAALGIAERCTFVGLANRARVRDEMRRCDVLLHASDAETFGMVVAEAMACGKPVIATRSGGPDYIVESGTGILVPVGDEVALTEALTRLIRQPALVSGAAARASVERRFGPRAFVSAIGSVYDSILASSTDSGRPHGGG